MTPQECRTESGFTKTRMFGPADFASDVVKQKWDRVRIICGQPFRRNVQMGLSFVRIKVPDNDESSFEKGKGNTPKSVKSIQKHFFGKLSSSDQKTSELKSKLMRISGSGENGIEQKHCLNRNAKLVLAATGNVDRFSVPPPISSPEGKSKLYSMRIAQQSSPKFEEDALSFLGSYEFRSEELDKITIADVRHKFEKRIKRKLTAEEKKTFMKLSSDYICEIFMESSSVNLKTKSHGPSSRVGDPFLEKDMNSMTWCHDRPSTHESPRTCGPSNKSPKIRPNSSVSKSASTQEMNSLPTSSTKDQWLNTSTHSCNGKRKRDGTNMEGKLNRGAKRQLLEEEERSWLGIESVTTGRVSTAVRPREGMKTGKVSNAVRPREGTGQKNSGKKKRNNSKSQTAVTPVEKQGVIHTESYSLNGPLCGKSGLEEYSLDSPTSFVECPLCGEMFPVESIEVHAAVCGEVSSTAYR